jgi:putative phage-type endonuclease
MMEQGTKEWHDLRRTKIGASDSPVIMGVSPWKNRDTWFKLWEEKILGKEQETTAAMARGIALEESARQRFQDKTGILMMPQVVLSKEREWQMASLDGISFDGTSILEIKHATKEIFQMAVQGNVPDYYMIQIQHALDTTGAAKCYYVVSDGEKDVWIEVFPDVKLIEKIREENEKFYEYITSKEPPPLTEKDYVKRNDKEFVDLMSDYYQVKTQIGILEDAEEKIKEDLIRLCDGKNAQSPNGRITRSVCKGQVEYKLVPELIGIDLEAYRKPPCEKWRITVITNNGA